MSAAKVKSCIWPEERCGGKEDRATLSVLLGRKMEVVQKVTVRKGLSLTGSVSKELCKEFVLHSIDPHGVGIGRPRPDHTAVL